MSDRQYYIYIMTNVSNSVLYIGMTNDLIRRVYEHKEGFIDGFTKRYHCKKLVYFEVFVTPYEAITREKQLKAGSRAKKLLLIETQNATWKDLYSELI